MPTQKYFYVSDGTNKIGPLSAEDIWKLINKNRVSLLDMIYDTRIRKWSSILKHEDFSKEEIVSADSVTDSLNTANSKDQLIGLLPESNVVLNLDIHAKPNPLLAKKPEPAQTKKYVPSPADTWHIKRGPHVMGPYSFLQIASFLQAGSLKFGDAIRNKEDIWKKVEDVFSVEEMNSLDIQVVRQNSVIRTPKGPSRRKEVRKEISNTLFISDSRLQYIVQGFDVTMSGIAFLTNAPHFSVGQPLSCAFVDRANQLTTLQGHVFRQDNLENDETSAVFYRFILRFEQALESVVFDKFQV